ncbi:Ig-like domain-containing protein [Methanobrevibacter sp.]|uniref:Ig-like domain-containing protein n=1 Tax=Methanobrevibacter sp. TaxID=66852 RepID=UPI0038688DF4
MKYYIANTTVKVNKAVPKDLIVVTQDVSYGEDLIVNVFLSDPVAYRINVTVGDQSKLLRLKDGKGTLKFSGLAAGTYTVVALYKGDANYAAVSADTFVEVKKATPNITVSAKTSCKYVVVDVSSADEVANLINVTVDNQSKLVSLSEGQGTVNFTDFEAGTYTVTATYKGDNNYSAVSVDTTVEVK